MEGFIFHAIQKRQGLVGLSITSFTKDKEITSHYMTITGILEIPDDIANKCPGIPSGKLLQVSSWGRKYYVNFDEYINCIDAFTNLLIIRKV